jgi:hypothetical protein
LHTKIIRAGFATKFSIVSSGSTGSSLIVEAVKNGNYVRIAAFIANIQKLSRCTLFRNRMMFMPLGLLQKKYQATWPSNEWKQLISNRTHFCVENFQVSGIQFKVEG